MMSVRATRNFERNVDAIQDFLGGDRAPAFDKLIEALTDEVIPLLEQQPGVGRPFLKRGFSLRGAALLAHVKERLGAREVREHWFRGFLLLSLVGPRTVYLLALRDQRQLRYTLGP
jgi:hypothetical protein